MLPFVAVILTGSIYTFSSTSSSESPSPPLESQHVMTSLPSSPITASIPIATTASASSSGTTLEESSPRHFQHPSPRTQQQQLVSQVTKVCRKMLWNVVLSEYQSLFLSSETFSRTHDCIVFFSCSKFHQSQFHCLLSWIQERTPCQANHHSLMTNRIPLLVFNHLAFHHHL